MKTIKMRELIAAGVRKEWNAFAAEHPMLAQVIDCEMLVEQSANLLADDPGFRTAYLGAVQASAGAAAIAEIVARFVRPAMRTLVGR